MPQVVKSSKGMNFVDRASKKHGANDYERGYGGYREEKESSKVKGLKGFRYYLEGLN